jgi:SAM-dependent methyltransferase
MDERPQDVVAAGYDAIAERFAAWQAGVVGDPRDRYVRELLARLPGRPDILEIGCGAGIEPTPTFARIGRLVGIDVSKAQIERARSAVPGAELIQADVTTAAFPPGSFDAVVALYVLTHVQASALPGLLERIAAWLRPGGLLLATLGTAPGDSVVDDWLGAPMFFSGHERETNERLVGAAGLEIVSSRIEELEEPESAPGAGPATVAFHWLLAKKPA